MNQAREHIQKTIDHLKNNRKVLEDRIEQTHKDAVRFSEQIESEGKFLQELEATLGLFDLMPKGAAT